MPTIRWISLVLMMSVSLFAHAASDEVSCPTLLQHSFLRLQDEKPQSLCQYTNKVVLVVNTASFCGFTRQYSSLEALYRRYQKQGLVVLGFPSNDFSQETGTNQEIAQFCQNTFGVQFPMFVKSHVKGPSASAFFQELGQISKQTPKWNFHKYLIGRDGKLIDSFPSTQEPNDLGFIKVIESQLARGS